MITKDTVLITKEHITAKSEHHKRISFYKGKEYKPINIGETISMQGENRTIDSMDIWNFQNDEELLSFFDIKEENTTKVLYFYSEKSKAELTITKTSVNIGDAIISESGAKLIVHTIKFADTYENLIIFSNDFNGEFKKYEEAKIIPKKTPITNNIADHTKKEAINHPSHYGGKNNPYEAIKVIEAWNANFNLGNTLKYIARHNHKGTPLQDLKKAAFYLQAEINKLEKQ